MALRPQILRSLGGCAAAIGAKTDNRNVREEGRSMRARRAVFVFVAVLVAVAPGWAQAPTGTISGHVISADGLPLPGVSVSVTGAHLQGIRTATTTLNGDYLVPLLPPGDYTVSFEIENFQSVREARGVAGTQTTLVDAAMSLAPISVAVSVVGQAQPFLDTA